MKTRNLYIVTVTIATMLSLAFIIGCGDNGNDVIDCCLPPDIGDETHGTFTDSRDGQTYKYVTIGSQIWMAENLNYGGPPNEPNSVGKCGRPDEEGSDFGFLEDSGGNCDKAGYGRLYDWATAMDIEMSGRTCSNEKPVADCGVTLSEPHHQGICPNGWHIPTDAEWAQLINFVGGEQTANPKLRATQGWWRRVCVDGECAYIQLNDATDDYGFAALPNGTGFVYTRISFTAGNDQYGHWWSVTEDDTPPLEQDEFQNRAWQQEISALYDEARRYASQKEFLVSVRCVRDD